MRKVLNKIFIFPVKIYQWIISPLFPGSCRHEPTCSKGPLKGMLLGIKRLSKCHPWGTWGQDPVPKKNVKKPNKENTNQQCSNQLIKAG